MHTRLLAALASFTFAGATSGQELGIRPTPAQASAPALPIVEQARDHDAILAMPSAATTNPKAAELPIEQRWSLTAGTTIGQNLKSWAGRANWTIVWQLPKDWIVPAAATFTGSFPDAATNVIETLAGNGALVRAQIYDANRTMVISGPGSIQQ